MRVRTNVSISNVLIVSFLVLIVSVLNPVWASSDQYTCPMHPHYIATTPGTCPICGMDLVPLAGDAETMENNNQPGNTSDDLQHRKSVTISPETIQNMGVRTHKVEVAFFGKNIRSFGLIVDNERLSFSFTSRIAGWVKELILNAVGDQVNEGDPVLKLYSPDLISAQKDYLASLSIGNKNRIRSSAQRLISMGVSQKVLSDLRETRTEQENVLFYSPGQGIVRELNVSKGSYIKPGTQIAKFQSFESVWVNASVAEKDLEFIQVGTQAKIIFPNIGNIELIAQVDYVHPTIDEASRTGQVRLVLENKEGKFKPGAYVDIVFQTDIQERLSVPSEAILRSAEGDYVVLAKGEGRFQPQAVKVGIQSAGQTEIKKGLALDEVVVVSGQFLLDSESSLREAFRKLQRTQTPLSLLKINKDQLAMIDHAVDVAIYLHKAETEGFEPKPHMISPALDLIKSLVPEFRNTQLASVLAEVEISLEEAKAAMTPSVRSRSIAQLASALKPWILEGKPKHYRSKGIKVFLDHGTGYHWIQLDELELNPYGQGHAVELKMPTKSKLNMPPSQPQSQSPVGGAHGNH